MLKKSIPINRITNPNPHASRLQIWKSILIIVLFFSSISITQAQDKKLEMTGFLEYLNNTWIPQGEIYNTIGMTDWQNQSSIYNRFNVWWTPHKNLVFYAGMRNNFTYGPLVANYNDLFSLAGMDYNKLITYDNGYLDLTFIIADGKSYILYTNFDRLSMQWTLDKFELTVGRQRINWGVNMIWNPNDIFNAYNYFDFNYIERLGSDAIKMELYTGDFSSVQIAGKLSYVQSLNDSMQINEELKLTTAAMYKFNKWNYDFQVFGGYMLTDFTAGLGWAGDIAGAGFTGEVSWFLDQENFADTNGVLVASIAVNYTFKNSIFINFSGIYNSAGASGPANANIGGFLGSASSIFATNLNAKNLTRSKFDIFGQISYPVTPLINLSLASIYNPYDKSVYVGPSVTFSLTDNISLLLNGQLFWGEELTEFGDIGQMVFLDLKWSF
ncbi:MAG: hypothetical protein DRI89_08890 [Bacteroidetes bacterium]|nr:MAG: hypothetical protein DRI89_08890 [Bacteroidota bacterium]